MQKRDTFLHSKSCRQGIIVSKFLLLYNWLNLAFLIFEEKKAIHQTRLLKKEASEKFKYEKNNNRYWNGAKLY